MIRWNKMKRILPLFALMTLLLSACGRADLSALNPQGPIAQDQFNLMMVAVAIMTIVCLAVIVIWVIVLLRFRRRKGDNSIPKQIEGNHKLEIIWTVIPILLLVVLAVPTVQQVFAQAKDYSNDPDALQVKVTSYLYWWEFEYPQLGITTAQELIVPTDKKVSFELVSADVKHSFWIPAIGGKLDTNPGMSNRFFLEFPDEGVYRGKCAELCGPSHALMEFKAKSVSPESFDRWVEAMKAPAVMPADPAIAEAFEAKCLVCHAVGDQGQTVAPNLTGLGSKQTVASILFNSDVVDNPQAEDLTTEENVKQWLEDPQKIKPGNMMPSADDLGLTPEELDGIAKYLASYKLQY